MGHKFSAPENSIQKVRNFLDVKTDFIFQQLLIADKFGDLAYDDASIFYRMIHQVSIFPTDQDIVCVTEYNEKGTKLDFMWGVNEIIITKYSLGKGTYTLVNVGMVKALFDLKQDENKCLIKN